MYPPVTSDDHAPPPPPPKYNQPAAPGFPVSYHTYNPPFPQHHQLPPPPMPREWSTSLFDCFSNFTNCCITLWCPCVTFGQVAEIVDKGSSSCGVSGALYTLITCLIGCGCLYSFFYRSKMRRQYNLKGGDCTDCLIHCFCEPCALCQEYRELENRGFDMSLGWHANIEKQNQDAGVTMTPTAPPVVNMTR